MRSFALLATPVTRPSPSLCSLEIVLLLVSCCCLGAAREANTIFHTNTRHPIFGPLLQPLLTGCVHPLSHLSGPSPWRKVALGCDKNGIVIGNSPVIARSQPNTSNSSSTSAVALLSRSLPSPVRRPNSRVSHTTRQRARGVRNIWSSPVYATWQKAQKPHESGIRSELHRC